MTVNPETPISQSPFSRHVRLLPRDSSGKSSYLTTDNPRSTVSRVADFVERAQLSSAKEMLARARTLAKEPAACASELRISLVCLAEEMDNVLITAESRGDRLRQLLPDEFEDTEWEGEQDQDYEDQGEEQTSGAESPKSQD